jgi:8-oxo-dGTP diphosphatase
MPKTDQGVSSDRYKLIPRTLIFLVCEQHILLLKGAANKRLWPNRYNGVGGHIERGEDVLSAAKRELVEETGLRIDSLWLCGTVTVDTGENTGIGIYVFKGESNSTLKLISSRTSHSQEGILEWVPLEQLNNLSLVEDLPVLLPKVLGSLISDPPFSAHYSYDDSDRLVIKFSN